MAWHELAFLALLALAALATAAWISRQLEAPLEWMIDSRLDDAGPSDEAPTDDDEPGFSLHGNTRAPQPRRGV